MRSYSFVYRTGVGKSALPKIVYCVRMPQRAYSFSVFCGPDSSKFYVLALEGALDCYRNMPSTP